MSEQISVVIPAYNAARYIREAVESVLSQDGVELDLIVVDDGSSDDTADIVASVRDPRITLIRGEHRGLSATRNAGAERARSGLLVCLDSDDQLLPGALARYCRAMGKSPDCVVVYGESALRSEGVREQDVYRDTVFGVRPSGDVLSALVQRNFLSMGASCVRTWAHGRVGGFRPDIDFAEDWEYWTRIALLGPFEYLPAPPVLVRRIRSSSQCRRRGVQPRALAPAMKAVFSNPGIVERLGPADLRRLHRRFSAHATAFCADQNLWSGQWADARRHIVRSLALHPLQPREWVLLAAAVARCIPSPLRERLW